MSLLDLIKKADPKYLWNQAKENEGTPLERKYFGLLGREMFFSGLAGGIAGYYIPELIGWPYEGPMRILDIAIPAIFCAGAVVHRSGLLNEPR